LGLHCIEIPDQFCWIGASGSASLAYISLIKQNWHAEAFRVGNAYQVVTNVGCDEAIGRIYSIAVGLEPSPGGILEYFFYIVTVDEISDKFTSIFNGLDSENVLPKVQRGAILRAILHATSNLLNQVNPEQVNWCTWDRNLPEKAMVKYSQVVKVFESCGYRIQSGEIHGQHFWSAERLNPPGFPFDQVEGDGK
jgi:hypothetical protein